MRGLRAAQLQEAFETALDWDGYLSTDPDRAVGWIDFYRELSLDEDQQRLIKSFTRQVRILVVSGIWCGDCVRQGPMIQLIAEQSPCVLVRYLDRETIPGLMDELSINGGKRVPVVVFMAEDHEPVSVAGDRTLNYYRHLAAARLGASCPIPGAPTDTKLRSLAIQDWLDEVERVHLLLRLSGRLRQLHGD